MIKNRFKISLRSYKECSIEDLFTSQGMDWSSSHRDEYDIQSLLEGFSLREMVGNFELIKDAELFVYDSETEITWKYNGYSWSKED